MRKSIVQTVCVISIGLASSIILLSSKANAAETQVARGKYLVTVSGCGDCHTPGRLLGKPDMARMLSGSDVGFAIPTLGVFVPPNLTPDRETGLGKWTSEQIVTALTTGQRPDGRVLAPIVPWQAFSQLTTSDAQAIAAYLKSLKPVQHAVPGPFGPSEKVSVFVMTALPAEVYNSLPPPGQPTAKGN